MKADFMHQVNEFDKYTKGKYLLYNSKETYLTI